MRVFIAEFLQTFPAVNLELGQNLSFWSQELSSFRQICLNFEVKMLHFTEKGLQKTGISPPNVGAWPLGYSKYQGA